MRKYPLLFIAFGLLILIMGYVSLRSPVLAAICGEHECDGWTEAFDHQSCYHGSGCPSYVCTKQGECCVWDGSKPDGQKCVTLTSIEDDEGNQSICDPCSQPSSNDECKLCTGDGGGDDDDDDDDDDTPAATPTPSCKSYPFKSGSISPNVIYPGGDVLIRCGYGADIDCINVRGGGLTNCTYRTYYNGEAVFACKAGANPGTYTDATCELVAGTAGNCCVKDASGSASMRVIGSYTVLSTSAHFEQRMRVPKGSYVLSVRAQTVISKGNGAFVDLLCASTDCGGGKKQNDSLVKIPLQVTTDFQTIPIPVTIPEDGNMKDYKVRIVAGEGSELYVDKVSFIGGGVEYVLNGEFKNRHATTVEYGQPNGWGDGDNKLGFFYGMAFDARIPPYTPPGIGGGSSSSGGSGGSSSVAPGSVNVKLSMKMKLQGVVTKPKTADPIYVKVKIGAGKLTQQTSYQTAKFTVGNDGVWTGEADFMVPPGEGYNIYLKGPKHLQKKICDSAPTESAGGTYHCGQGKIELKEGTNSLDVSKILMLVGDLPENGTQNGIIDAYDTGFVRTHLQSTNASDLTIGDLNYDGVIDSQDFSLVLASLSIKYDEE